VLVKRLSSLQQLGSIKYLLTDKTGTLTENTIRIVESLDKGTLVRDASLIAQAEYERTPMDKSLDESILGKFPIDASSSQAEAAMKLKFTPFKNKTGYAMYSFSSAASGMARDSASAASGASSSSISANSIQEIIRGQYIAIIAMCSGISAEEKADLDGKYAHYESQGLRVIACASRTKDSSVGAASLDANPSIAASPAANLNNFKLSGLLVFEDPLKPDAVHSYKAAEGLGISVKVLTGDSQMVALYIAQKLDSHMTADQVCSVDTTSIKSLTDADLDSDKVYARCQPEEKLELIDRHLQKGGVAFLGEGINDALALKRADVGMVVYNASDVARQSADILLMEKSLNPVIKAIQMSRRVYAHISTYLLCTLTGNIGTLFSLTVVALFWNELPMLPVQILLNNLLTDVPLILLITDRLVKEDYSTPIEHSPKNFFKIIAVFGLLSTVFDMGYFFIFKDYPLASLRTGWFVFSILCELILVLSLRTNRVAWKGSRMSSSLILALGSCALFAVVSPYIPFASIFELVPLSLGQISFTIAFTAIYFLANEILKLKFKAGASGSASSPSSMPAAFVASKVSTK
jgi:Mg2+-importing ATPase